jgi:hypothetical protein
MPRRLCNPKSRTVQPRVLKSSWTWEPISDAHSYGNTKYSNLIGGEMPDDPKAGADTVAGQGGEHVVIARNVALTLTQVAESRSAQTAGNDPPPLITSLPPSDPPDSVPLSMR